MGLGRLRIARVPGLETRLDFEDEAAVVLSPGEDAGVDQVDVLELFHVLPVKHRPLPLMSPYGF